MDHTKTPSSVMAMLDPSTLPIPIVDVVRPSTPHDTEQASLLRLLSDTLLQQAEASMSQLEDLVSQQLRALTGADVCAFSRYHPDEQVLVTRRISAEKRLLDLAFHALGGTVIGMKTPVSGEMLQQMRTSTLVDLRSLTIATNGSIPARAGRIIQEVTGLDRYRGVSFQNGDEVYGVAILCFRRHKPEPSASLLRFYSAMTSATFRWKQASESLERLSLHDALTELPNRRFFNQVLAAFPKKGCWPVSLMMIDMDNLKTINDRDGHESGDMALCSVATSIAECLRPHDMLARIGGDEFALLLPGTDASAADRLSRKIREAIGSQIQGSGSIQVCISIGSATSSETGSDLQAVLRQADERMYEEKKGKQRACKGSDLIG